MTKGDWSLIKDVIKFLNRDKIPKDTNGIFRMLHDLEAEKKEYDRRQDAIKRIKYLQRLRRERNKKPDRASIYKKCKWCKELYLKSEVHEC